MSRPAVFDDSMRSAVVTTIVGDLGLVEREGELIRLDWHGREYGAITSTLKTAVQQVQQYFAGEREDFELLLAPSGSAFQLQVYAAMQSIPFGQTQSYGEMANSINSFAQAVGQACGSNPLPLIIPCHRVLATNGLGGYSGFGGLETKIKLLQHEHAYPYLL